MISKLRQNNYHWTARKREKREWDKVAKEMVWLSGTGTAGMARLSSSSTTTTFSFKPNSLSSLSSSFNNNNHLFTTLRLNYPTSSSFHLQYASSSVSARYGGGGGGSFSRPGSGDFRRSREDSFDDDQALDISGIR